MDEAEAVTAARAHADRHVDALVDRSWRATRFDGGWLMNAEGEDLARRTGVPCLIVLDDGTVHEESSSLPPSMLISRYASSG